jgi:hypothetical protein
MRIMQLEGEGTLQNPRAAAARRSGAPGPVIRGSVPAFEALNRQADALYVVADGLVAARSSR